MHTIAEKHAIEQREELIPDNRILVVLQAQEDNSLLELTVGMGEYSKLTNLINNYTVKRQTSPHYTLVAIRSFRNGKV